MSAPPDLSTEPDPSLEIVGGGFGCSAAGRGPIGAWWWVALGRRGAPPPSAASRLIGLTLLPILHGQGPRRRRLFAGPLLADHRRRMVLSRRPPLVHRAPRFFFSPAASRSTMRTNPLIRAPRRPFPSPERLRSHHRASTDRQTSTWPARSSIAFTVSVSLPVQLYEGGAALGDLGPRSGAAPRRSAASA